MQKKKAKQMHIQLVNYKTEYFYRSIILIVKNYTETTNWLASESLKLEKDNKDEKAS